ncbi:hypothetical protein [Diaphorobacter aerolatus]|uniref:Uncharacterized protein n=1 Tax=Diaphorobacter aerolatus TaxID=1288495 RepID=A0A7H0GKY0_9BURK|nr:hypothetical protein [Diaphorobacter aerolatus]QNP48946.1 hypothetical protein H9K75_01745 [Diaphorobacter aerolatus]
MQQMHTPQPIPHDPGTDTPPRDPNRPVDPSIPDRPMPHPTEPPGIIPPIELPPDPMQSPAVS